MSHPEKDKNDPLDICRNIFDLIELYCDNYIKYPKNRESTLEQITFYFGLLPSGAIHDFGRLYIRLQFLNFVNELNNIDSWENEDWDDQISHLLQLRKDICRNDATACILPSKILGPNNTKYSGDGDGDGDGDVQDSQDNKDDEEDMDPEYLAKIDDMRDKSENTDRVSKLDDIFKSLELQMRIQQGLVDVRNQMLNESDKLKSMEALKNYKAFILGHLQVENPDNGKHLSDIDELKEQLKECLDKDDKTTDKELWTRFESKENYSLETFKDTIENTILICYKELPCPILVKLKYGDPSVEEEAEEAEEKDSNSVVQSKHKLEINSPKSRVQELETARTHPMLKCLRETRIRKRRKLREAVTNLKESMTEVEDPLDKSYKTAQEATLESGDSKTSDNDGDDYDDNDNGEDDGDDDDDDDDDDELIDSPETVDKVLPERWKGTSSRLSFDDSVDGNDDNTHRSKATSGEGIQKRKKWTYEEDQALRKGVKRCGVGNWSRIKEIYAIDLTNRTNVNIKDRYRTLLKRGEI